MTVVTTLKTAVKRTVGTKIGWRLLSRTVRRPGLTVLAYHGIVGPDSPVEGLPHELFEEQIDWLRRRCEIIAPDRAEAAAREPRRSRPSVMLTFDDAYRNFIDNAYPVLRRHSLPAILFVPTSVMSTRELLWPDRVALWIARAPARRVTLPWTDATFDIAQPQERQRLLAQCKRDLKAQPDAQRIANVDRLHAALEIAPALLEVERVMMDWNEVRSVMDLVEIGGHSHRHPILSRVGPGALEDEIATCRSRIEVETGKQPRFFAYPNGEKPDYNEAVKAAVGRSFRAAFTMVRGIAGPGTDWLEVPRIDAEATNVTDFAWIMSAL